MGNLGIIVILTLPYMAGYILKNIMNNKEISQIETYLIGFFFVLLLQGGIFSIGNLGLNKSFAQISNTMWIITVAIFVLFLLLVFINMGKRIKKGHHDNVYHAKWHRQDLILLAFVVLVGLAVVFRVITLKDYLRSDLMLATVRTTISTGTMFEYNPIISQPFTLGLISSKKIITLPLYYAYLISYFGIDEILLLYIVLSLQTIMCAYFACISFMVPIIRNRRKSLIFAFFLGTVLLSGDYYSGTVGTKLLWHGYLGESIVAAVMIPYVMYVITAWYRQERNYRRENADNNNTLAKTEEERSKKSRIRESIHIYVVNILKLLICLGASLFITGITAGFLIVAITIVILGICSISRFIVEEVE